MYTNSAWHSKDDEIKELKNLSIELINRIDKVLKKLKEESSETKEDIILKWYKDKVMECIKLLEEQ